MLLLLPLPEISDESWAQSAKLLGWQEYLPAYLQSQNKKPRYTEGN